MADYRIIFVRSARRELERLPAEAGDRILRGIERLAEDPRPPSVVKLRSSGNYWRIRVGDYRVVYSINDADQIVTISVVRHRRDVYRNL